MTFDSLGETYEFYNLILGNMGLVYGTEKAD
jgi:hypothetical protein